MAPQASAAMAVQWAPLCKSPEGRRMGDDPWVNSRRAWPRPEYAFFSHTSFTRLTRQSNGQREAAGSSLA